MERRGVPATRTTDQGSSSASSASDHVVHGPSSPGATGTSGLGAAAMAIADIERQLDRLITQRKTEKLVVAHAMGENGNNDQRKKVKSGAATREEDSDSNNSNSNSAENAASDAQQSKRRNLDEDLLIGMLGIPFVSSEVARGRSPRPHSSPTMSTSPPLTPTPTAHTPLTPDMAANAAVLVLGANLGQGDTHRSDDDTLPNIATESVWQAPEAAHKPPSPPTRSLASTPTPPLPEQQSQPVVVAAALRREIMGEVKAELLMEVARRDKENQGKLYDLERENRELKQELHGLLREMREDRRRKEREREERRKRRRRSAGQRTKRGRGSSDDSEGSDVESSDDDMRSSSEQEVVEPKRRGTKRSRASSDREPADRSSDKSDANSKRKRGKASVAPTGKAESETEQQRSTQAVPTTPEPDVPPVTVPSRADTRSSPQPRADRWSHSSGSGGEETTATAAIGPEDRKADDGDRPSRSTVWRRKKGRRAAEEIEHDNQERWQMRVDQLRAFAKEHGHCRVPKSHPNRPLYTWTQNVRQRWRRGAVPENKIRDLVALGMQHPAEEFGGAAVRRGSQQQRPAGEPATEEDVDTSRDQESKAVDKKSSTSNGRPRAVKRSRREKRASSANTKAGGGEDGKRPQQSRTSDDDYAALSEKDHEDDEEEEEEEEEDEEEMYPRRPRQRQPRRSEEVKPHDAVDGVVTRRRAKSLTAQAEVKEPAKGEKRKSTTPGPTDKETKSPKKRAKLVERKSESGIKSEGEDAKAQKQQKKKASIDESEEEETAKRSDYEDEEEEGGQGDEIPESHVNQKWLQRFEALKAWQKQHNLSRPNRKQSASLGRWSDEQLNRARSGMLLPWRRKLLDATGFFASTLESS